MKTIPMTIDEIKAHFPAEIPEAFLREVDRARKPRYIWLLKGDTVHCDMCGREFPARYMNHRQMEECPCCHSRLEARKTWVGQKSARRNVISYHFARSVLDKKVLTCMAVYTCYGFEAGKAPWKTPPFRRVEALYVFKAGEGAAYAAQYDRMWPSSLKIRHGSYFYNWGHGIVPVPDELTERKRLQVRDAVYAQITDKPEILIGIYEAGPGTLVSIARGTPFYYLVKAYSEMMARIYSKVDTIKLFSGDAPRWERVYGRDYWLRLLERGTKYPLALEQIAKMGLGKALYKTVLLDNGLSHVFNLQGQTINKIFKGPLTKADKKYMYGHGDSCDIGLIELWQKCRQNGFPESLEWLAANISSKKRSAYIEMAGLFGKPAGRYNVKLPQVISYIAKQEKKQELKCARYSLTMVDESFYRDYIRDCVTLSTIPEYAGIYDLRRKDVWFPQRLDAAHQQTIDIKARQKAIESMAANVEQLRGPEEKYKKLRQMLKARYSFAAGGYQIIVPPDLKDLYREGAEMHTCIASYINRAANDTARILYIRSEKEPEKSLGAMEIRPKDETIIQARGKYNQKLPAEVARFVKLFEKKILMPLRGERVRLAC